MNERDELLTAAMQIILHIGNACGAADETLGGAKCFNFQEAASYLQKAKKAITLTHKSQTDIIQKETGEYGCEPGLLFAYVQDTLMTVKSELHLSRQLIDVLGIIKSSK